MCYSKAVQQFLAEDGNEEYGRFDGKNLLDANGNVQEAIVEGFHILEGVTLPNGVVKTANGTFDYTQYTSMIDLPNKVYYFKTYENPQIIQVDLKPVWASGEQTVRDLGSIHVPVRYGTME